MGRPCVGPFVYRMSLWIFCPCGFRIHRGINSGSATRADNISAFTVSGITNPRGHRSDNGNDNDTRPCGFAIHRVVNCGSATRADWKSANHRLGDYKSPRTRRHDVFIPCRDLACLGPCLVVHFFFARAKKKPNQRRNSPADRKKAKNQSMFS